MNPFEIFGGMSNPSHYYQAAIADYQPYYAAGTKMLPEYTSTITNLTKHPTALENQIMGSYTESPYAQYQTQLLNKSMASQAAAGGQLGTPNEQIALANQTQGIVSKDQQQYYEDAMQPYQMGLQGEQYITGEGLKAGKGMAGQEDLQAKAAAKEKEAEASMFGSIAGGAAKLAGELI